MAREEKKIHYIYKTTCLISNRYYIGLHSTNNLNDGYMGSGKRLRYSIRKHGVENHIKEILEFLPTREDLVLREIEIVTKELIEDKSCMNLVLGGGGFMLDDFHYECAKNGNKKLNELLKNNSDFRFNWLLKMKAGVQKAMDDGKMKTWKDTYNWSGKTHTEETKEKISKKMGEIGNSQLNSCWVSKDEIKRKISIDELDNYISNGWVRGKISNIKEIIDFYLDVKSFGKTSKHFKINKRTLIDNIRLNE
jgi:hypothetical protein